MKFLLGYVTSTILTLIIILGCWLYFDFSISTNDEIQEEPQTQQIQQEKINDEQQQNIQEQKEPSTIPTHEKEQRLPNLHDKQKAMYLMKQERSDLSDEDKKIYDSVIETAKTNIKNGLGNHEDYDILNEYNK